MKTIGLLLELVIIASGLTTSRLLFADAACSLCKDGVPTTVPDKIVSLPGDYPDLDCATLQSVVPALFTTDEECAFVHQFSSICACARPSDSCNLCPDGSPVGSPDAVAPGAFETLFGSPLTCDVVEAYLHSFPADDDICAYSHAQVASSCGCSGVVFNETTNNQTATWTDPNVTLVDSGVITVRYFGAKTLQDRQVQRNIYLASAILSILGALAVIIDFLASRKRQSHIYNQIIFVMAAFDVIHAVSAAFGPLSKPLGTNLGGVGAKGTAATCKAQGFFFLLGLMVSLFFNGALAVYFVWVIVRGYRERKLLRLRKWLIGVPILLGLTFACASIPFIVPAFNGCSVSVPTSLISTEIMARWGFATSWGPFLGLFLVPGFVVLIFSTGCMVRVYVRVRKARKGDRRWNMIQQRQRSSILSSMRGGGGRRRLQRSISRLHQEVAWQSGLYLFALYISWFTNLIVSANIDEFLLGYYYLWCFVHFVVPLQPLLNSVVYFRPRITSLCRRGCRKVKRTRLWGGTSTEGDQPSMNSSMNPWSVSNAELSQRRLDQFGSYNNSYNHSGVLATVDESGRDSKDHPEGTRAPGERQVSWRDVESGEIKTDSPDPPVWQVRRQSIDTGDEMHFPVPLERQVSWKDTETSERKDSDPLERQVSWKNTEKGGEMDGPIDVSSLSSGGKGSLDSDTPPTSHPSADAAGCILTDMGKSKSKPTEDTHDATD